MDLLRRMDQTENPGHHSFLQSHLAWTPVPHNTHTFQRCLTTNQLRPKKNTVVIRPEKKDFLFCQKKKLYLRNTLYAKKVTEFGNLKLR